MPPQPARKPQRPRKGAKPLAEFVVTARPKSHCITCNDATVSGLCSEFVAMRRAGKAKQWQSWQWFVEAYLRGELGLEVRYSSVLRHVRECLQAVDRGKVKA